jgi:2-polyprenyl-3-methyl-5-hydroxy-6-metoxy-1,4-benzoquinol methylase
MVRFGKWSIYHKRIMEHGFFGRFYVKILGCVSLTAYNYYFFLKRAIEKIHFTTVLDAGCGKGDFTFYLAERFPNAKIVGWDSCNPDLHELRDNIIVCNKIRELANLKNTEFHTKDLVDLDQQQQYDFIFSIHVLEHIHNNRKVLENIYNALKNNGYLHLQMPSNVEMKPFFPKKWFKQLYEWEEKEHIGDVYTLSELKDLLEKTGFHVQSARTDGGFIQAFAWQLGEVLVSHRLFIPFAFLLPLLKMLTYIGNLLIDDGNGSLVFLAQKIE